ncbi:hypothetical protein CALVIDRAFT_560805 [Calocera viscosa TUFC12733]|uniref:Uncharacterized protein n=1 Tax=Calocera viscosa (strain TUFC12733) TaxID=1330018 RepID=A0A167QT79_CALVF|nr:hypothetical protein CALVIDRAFT_560805 [Calocera viscosa TUFC12733]
MPFHLGRPRPSGPPVNNNTRAPVGTDPEARLTMPPLATLHPPQLAPVPFHHPPATNTQTRPLANGPHHTAGSATFDELYRNAPQELRFIIENQDLTIDAQLAYIRDLEDQNVGLRKANEDMHRKLGELQNEVSRLRSSTHPR